jgi:hypothetical protein
MSGKSRWGVAAITSESGKSSPPAIESHGCTDRGWLGFHGFRGFRGFRGVGSIRDQGRFFSTRTTRKLREKPRKSLRPWARTSESASPQTLAHASCVLGAASRRTHFPRRCFERFVRLLVALFKKSGFAGVGIASRIAAIHPLRRACSIREHGLVPVNTIANDPWDR